MPFVQNTEDHTPDDLPPADLTSADPDARRRAAREMNEPAHLAALAEALGIETDKSVQVAILDAFRSIGGSHAAERLVPFLASDVIEVRTGAVSVLKDLGDDAAGALRTALEDADADIRIMTLDVVQDLRAVEISDWLIHVLQTDSHPNVVGTALDRLVEVGTRAHLATIRATSDRFPDDPFIAFAVTRAVEAIERGSHDAA